MNQTKPKLLLILSAVIFGTVGLFRRLIPLSSGLIAFTRALIGVVFLIIFVLITKKKFDFATVKKHAVTLIVSGALIAFNWIFLFEAYNYTSVAVATICSYMAPIFVIIASPFIFREKLIPKKIICVAVAMIGIVFVSGIITNGFKIEELKGAALAVIGATLYASAVICNKKTAEVATYDKTIVQLLSATVVLIPYVIVLFVTNNVFIEPTVDVSPAVSYTMLAVLGVLHTGITYAIYFSAIGSLDSQSIAILSYIDPIVAIILSTLILHESIGPFEIVGAVLILGATLVSELEFKKIKNN